MTAARAHWSPLLVWFVLVALTIGGWLFVEEAGMVRAGATIVAMAAAIKISLLIAQYMEVKWRPRPWRMLLSVWTAVVTSIVLGGYWLT